MPEVRVRRALLVGIPILVALVWSAFYAQFTVDDAFIFFRYGKVLKLHHVWSWNPVGAPIESYTSTLYGFLSVVPVLLHVPPIVVYKLVGLACILTMAFLLRRVSRGATAGLVAVALLLCHPYTWIHAYSCVETPLFMLLVLWMTLAVTFADQDVWWARPWVAYVVALALPLARPEGAVLGGVGALLYLYTRRPRAKDVVLIVALLTLAVVYYVIRFRYFGFAFPDPAYVKVANASLGTFIDMLDGAKWYLVALAGAAIITRNWRTRAMILTGVVVMCLLYFPHYLAMNYSSRFAFQISFPLILAVLATLSEVELRTAKVAIVFLVALCTFETKQLHEQLIFYPYLEAAHINLGKKLAPFAAGHSLIGGDMGGLPYYSDWVSYDIWGLCTNETAHRGVTPEFVAKVHPDLWTAYSYTSTGYEQTIPAQQVIGAYIAQQGNYKYIGAVEWKEFHLVEYLRTDTPDYDAIVKALQAANAESDRFVFHTKDVLKQKYLLDQLKKPY